MADAYSHAQHDVTRQICLLTGIEPQRYTAISIMCGGDVPMESILNRLGAVETSVSDIRAQVAGMASVMPHLATKADVNAVKAEVHSMESSLLKWLIGTLIAGVALACTIAKLIG